MKPAVLSTLAVAALALAARAADPPKPNIVLFLMDDMGYGDVSPFNPDTKNRTPNVERMAKEGMKLTSFYAAPVCTPSRAQILTGCYAKRVSLPQVLMPASPIGLNRDEHTVASLLKARGYATLCVGKWHVGDQPDFLPAHYGFDHYFGLPYSNDMGGEWDGAEDAPTDKRKPPLPLVRDEKVIETLKPADQDRLTERYTDEAVRFIQDHKDSPFFLYLAHTAVHVPLHPGAKFKGKSANGTYGDWVEESDASLGRVMDTIRELRLEENTLVIFSSDNGPWLIQGKDGGIAGPLRGGKGGTYEGGMREPTIAWWPGHIAPGSSCDAVAGNIDLLPTFVHVAGGAAPDDRKIDGADIMPLLTGKTKESQRPAHFYFNGNRLEAVRSGPWKLAVAPQKEQTGKPEPKEPEPFRPKLYNLDDDIGERTDVAEKHPDVVKRLQEFAAQMDADLGAKGTGPGVRAPGKVETPRPLLLK
ncbi:MAG TPA: sulfatase [Gemmataceae bacterium]|nr:sulfatase [Gemmataceae bacterium]